MDPTPIPPVQVPESLKPFVNSEVQYIRLVDKVSSKKKRQRRVLAITGNNLVLADPANGNVRRFFTDAETKGLVWQDVKKKGGGMERRIVVHIEGEHDLVITQVEDKKNPPGSHATDNELLEKLPRWVYSGTGKAIPVTQAPEAHDIIAESDRARKPGYNEKRERMMELIHDAAKRRRAQERNSSQLSLTPNTTPQGSKRSKGSRSASTVTMGGRSVTSATSSSSSSSSASAAERKPLPLPAGAPPPRPAQPVPPSPSPRSAASPIASIRDYRHSPLASTPLPVWSPAASPGSAGGRDAVPNYSKLSLPPPASPANVALYSSSQQYVQPRAATPSPRPGAHVADPALLEQLAAQQQAVLQLHEALMEKQKEIDRQQDELQRQRDRQSGYEEEYLSRIAGLEGQLASLQEGQQPSEPASPSPPPRSPTLSPPPASVPLCSPPPPAFPAPALLPSLSPPPPFQRPDEPVFGAIQPVSPLTGDESEGVTVPSPELPRFVLSEEVEEGDNQMPREVVFPNTRSPGSVEREAVLLPPGKYVGPFPVTSPVVVQQDTAGVPCVVVKPGLEDVAVAEREVPFTPERLEDRKGTEWIASSASSVSDVDLFLGRMLHPPPPPPQKSLPASQSLEHAPRGSPTPPPAHSSVSSADTTPFLPPPSSPPPQRQPCEPTPSLPPPPLACQREVSPQPEPEAPCTEPQGEHEENEDDSDIEMIKEILRQKAVQEQEKVLPNQQKVLQPEQWQQGQEEKLTIPPQASPIVCQATALDKALQRAQRTTKSRTGLTLQHVQQQQKQYQAAQVHQMAAGQLGLYQAPTPSHLFTHARPLVPPTSSPQQLQPLHQQVHQKWQQQVFPSQRQQEPQKPKQAELQQAASPVPAPAPDCTATGEVLQHRIAATHSEIRDFLTSEMTKLSNVVKQTETLSPVSGAIWEDTRSIPAGKSVLEITRLFRESLADIHRAGDAMHLAEMLSRTSMLALTSVLSEFVPPALKPGLDCNWRTIISKYQVKARERLTVQPQLAVIHKRTSPPRFPTPAAKLLYGT